MPAAPATRVLPDNVMPASFTTTHDTDGLPGWGALDWFRKAGTIVGLPVGGTVVEVRPARGGSSGVYGTHVRFRTDTGKNLFMTHFDRVFVRAGDKLAPGEALGTVHPFGNGAHIHIAVQGAADRGGKVNLGDGKGGDDWKGGKPPSGGNLIPNVGGVDDAIGGIKGALNPFDDIGAWLSEYGVRAVQVLGGGALLLVGLALLARRAAR